MEMSHIVSKLKGLKLELSDDLLVHLVSISLHAQFSQFKVSYNCQKDKWSLNELILYCVQEEERLKQEITESTHLTSTSKEVKIFDVWRIDFMRSFHSSYGQQYILVVVDHVSK